MRRGLPLNEQLVVRMKAAGLLRKDLDANDLTYVFEQLSCLNFPTPQRNAAQLRSRYLALHLPAGPRRTPLPGPPPTAKEVAARWQAWPPEAVREAAMSLADDRSGDLGVTSANGSVHCGRERCCRWRQSCDTVRGWPWRGTSPILRSWWTRRPRCRSGGSASGDEGVWRRC